MHGGEKWVELEMVITGVSGAERERKWSSFRSRRGEQFYTFYPRPVPRIYILPASRKRPAW